jgi:DNA sulfur modification protein DndD
MKITQISLENFRQHKKIEIELDTSRSSFTIIKGRNGSGKTNLLKAITWALTGKLAKDEIKFDPISLVSISSASAAKEGDILEVSVRLDLDLGSGKSAQIERVARFIKSGSGARDISHSSTELSVLTLEDKLKGYQKEPSPELWVEKVFPDRFSHYFLFDGEHLHRFFKDTEAVHVKRAVLEIANIDQLEKIVEHLSTVNQSLVKEAGSVAGVKGEELRKIYEHHETKIQELEKDLQEKNALKIELDEELTIAREKMGDIAAIQKDISLRNQLEKSAQSASDRAAEAKRELSAWAFKVGPAIMLSNQLQKLQDQIDAAREKRVLPPDYKPEALIELLKSGSCICGRGLEKDSDACTHVEKLLAEFSDLSEIGSVLSELQQPLQFLNGQIDSSPNTLRSTQERIKSALKDESEAMSQLSVIQQKLSTNDDSQVAFIANRHDDAKRALESVLKQVGSLGQQLQEQKERLESVRKEIETEAATKEKSRVALQRQRFAESTLSTAKKMYQDFSNQVRAKVAHDLNDEFQSMVWKKNFFKPIEIDEDYRVLVFNKQGAEIRSLLSAGETACLAFAFSLTLSDVAGFSYPMVVDSPLGRLDKEVKEFVSGVLAKALQSEEGSEGKQILMLMTDSEYNTEVADALAHMKPKVLEIVFDQDHSESKVVSVQ